jgi:uncharacterized protein (TIGR03067 family)
MMRTLKVSVLGLALLAGACGVAETSRPSSNGSSEPPEKEFAPPRESKEEAVQRDLQQLRGTWIAVDIEHDGGKETPQGGLKWIFQGDTYEIWIGKQKMETNRVTLDPTRTPGTIEMKLVGGSKGSPRVTGIYALEGDTLKVCYDLTGRGYPGEFSAPRGASRIAYVFRRQ